MGAITRAKGRGRGVQPSHPKSQKSGPERHGRAVEVGNMGLCRFLWQHGKGDTGHLWRLVMPPH